MSEQKTWDETVIHLVNTRIVPDYLFRVLLVGPSHTGKSTLPLNLMPNCLRGTCNKQQPIDDWAGGYGMTEGTTKWQDGLLVRALRNGWPIVIDEIDKHSPECASFFYAALDNPAGITLPTGERVMAKKGYCVFATSNANPTTLPEPIYNRFDIILKADTISKGLQEHLGVLSNVAKTVIARNANFQWDGKLGARLGTYIAAAQLINAGLSGDQLTDALGLFGQEATDFLAAMTS